MYWFTHIHLIQQCITETIVAKFITNHVFNLSFKLNEAGRWGEEIVVDEWQEDCELDKKDARIDNFVAVTEEYGASIECGAARRTWCAAGLPLHCLVRAHNTLVTLRVVCRIYTRTWLTIRCNIPSTPNVQMYPKFLYATLLNLLCIVQIKFNSL